jgi:L-lactate dehydrogenase (cytochrome)
MDGGVRRGTDVLKALALGAKAVGIGRPALYSLATYGTPGIERMLSIFRDELHVGMRLIGCADVAKLDPTFVATKGLSTHVGPSVADRLSDAVYQPVPLSAKL